MECKVAVDFFKALASLQKSEQRQVRETLSAILTGSQAAGLRAHKIQHPSANIVSYSPNMDLRIIAHQDATTLTFLYVDHHDAAYAWVERRRFIGIGDSFRVVLVPQQTGSDAPPPKLPKVLPKVLSSSVDEQLPTLSPEPTTDDEVLTLIDRMPLGDDQKNQLLERLLLRSREYRLLPQIRVFVAADDASLQDALEYPLDLWRVFLHPRQKQIIEQPLEQGLMVTGGPGTGKTVCLVHRAKQIAKTLQADEVILFTTYKSSLATYILDMFAKLGVDSDRVVVADVVQLDDVEVANVSKMRMVRVDSFAAVAALWEGESAPEGCLLIHGDDVWFSRDRVRRRVRHLLGDECQDYRDRQLQCLEDLCQRLPHTLAFDYTQSIYRPSPVGATLFSEARPEAQFVQLDYCYRLNHQIVKRIKAVVRTIQIMASFANAKSYRLPLSDVEERLIGKLTPVLDGTPPMTRVYDDERHLNELLHASVEDLLKSYSPSDIVITRFFPDIYKHGREGPAFGADGIPEDLRTYYKYVYTLKGQEYKAGILVLDDTMSQLLNINQVVFTSLRPTGILGDADNLRRMYNLLYVGLSRFRDFLAILYPAKYALVLDAIFRDVE